MRSRPTVCFIVATHNRGPVLVDCLRRTLRCGLPASQFRVVVVDNASTDDTPELVEALAAEHTNLTLFRLETNAGPVAKNVGMHGNPADLLVLLDDDAYPQPGAVRQMLRHFADDPRLGAAVFDVTLPDGRKEGSAYPDVFIGAGTGLRSSALRELPGGGLLPADFFMQAEEYDLSFRLIAAGYSVQRFWDMPLMHLKSPGARIGQRTTRLDVRNNLYLLAKYLPEPLCHELAADWLARYWRMAMVRDRERAADREHGTHAQAYLRGAAEGLAKWAAQRRNGRLLLRGEAIERIFKFETILERLGRAQRELGLKRIAFVDWGKNMLPFHRAAAELGLAVAAVLDERLGSEPGARGGVDYRGIPVIGALEAGDVDGLVLTTISRVHATVRAAELRRTSRVPVVDLFSKRPLAGARGVVRGGLEGVCTG